MVRATLRVKSNDALVALSEAHPETQFDILGAWPEGEHLRTLIEASPEDGAGLLRSLDSHPSITDVEVRQQNEGSVLFEANTPVPDPHGAMAGSGIVPSFPMTLRDGWIVSELIAPREKISEFRAELDRADIRYRLDSISPEENPGNLLTDRQREVMASAIEAGYYEIPRRCTLTSLAEQLDVDKSVVSRILRRGEGRIVMAYWK